MAMSLSSLLVQQTKQAIYATGLAVARSVGLPVTSWQVGDPTRSLYWYLAEVLAALEAIVASYAASGFLDYATGDRLTLLAKQVYNTDRIEATYAETAVVLTNAGGGVFDFDAGDLTFKDSSTGATYHNTSGGHLAGLGTLSLDVVADDPGSDGSASATDIDALVTTLLSVTCSNADTAVGLDEETDESLRSRCRDKLGSLSPEGPAAAYSYVARNPDLALTSGVTRVRVYPDSTTGQVLVYLAGPSGGVSSGDRTLVETAIVTYATPLCITPTVLAASNHTIAVTYTVWLYASVSKTSSEVQAAIATALESLFAVRPIGGDIIPPATTGAFDPSLIVSAIRAAFPDKVFKVTVAAPAASVALTNAEVPVLGAVSPTVHFVTDPV